jgi:hypothetical protein
MRRASFSTNGVSSSAGNARLIYKEIRKRALQGHNPDALIGLELPAEFVEFPRQKFIKKIYRRVIDADECDSEIKPEPETFVVRISMGVAPFPWAALKPWGGREY